MSFQITEKDGDIGYTLVNTAYLLSDNDDSVKRIYQQRQFNDHKTTNPLEDPKSIDRLKKCSDVSHLFNMTDISKVLLEIKLLQMGGNVDHPVVSHSAVRKNILLRMNGRNFYDYYINQNLFFGIRGRLLSDPYSIISTYKPMTSGWIKMYGLICSQIRTGSVNNSENILKTIRHLKYDCATESVEENCINCTTIGKKVAVSLIKIATRIFASPEQSILEIPVNSIDAYSTSAKIGKFGMGFFSFLYWLVGHPTRELTIESFTSSGKTKVETKVETKVCNYACKVKEIVGVDHEQ